MRAQLVAALEESLDVAPESSDVLAGLLAGIRRRRRRVRIGTVAGVVLLAVVASTVTISLTRGRSNPPAGPAPAPGWRLSVQAGWVPDGMVLIQTRAGAAGEGFAYRSRDTELNVAVTAAAPGGDLAAPGRAVRKLGSGRWADVRLTLLPNGTLGEPELRVRADRVAGSLHEGADLPVRVDVAPTYLPDGVRVVGVSADATIPGRGTVYCAAQSEPVRLTVSFTLVNLLTGSERIGEIQGRPAYLADNRRTVAVNIYHGGMLAVSAVGDTPPPLAELIKVADGVRWVG
ncbi:MAG: hypothetical protein ACJ72N_17305 [Labedaea sp.]